MKERIEGLPEDWRWLALIIDNEVVSRMAWDPRLAAILLSNPVVVDLEDKWDEVFEGFGYVDGEFIQKGEEVGW
ncbi:hypothetical protein UFOVP204_40 [uncultured Caudovirales phage]|uniref:Uncharacterized protein n=1 Tax=uncultured Caudovirales phage TaxID=2100421 RepID=A0A6J7WMX9_9CAUD|nr:hypothetical protein UFOVP204_40 [uncultured Caudovirales phage]